ncbi:MAG: hypothetical protein L0Y74_03650 [candidate division Zixibacteria bacterium]|nr:hypothetical protein [candidate division Zixibacteria bacterium]
MKTHFSSRIAETRCSRIAKVMLAGAISGCGAVSEPIVTEVNIPNPPASYPEARPHFQENVPTELTLLRTGTVFLAFVSVPSGDSREDLQDVKVSFFYKAPGKTWSPILECQSVVTCDVSGLIKGSPLTIKAKFSPEYGSDYSPSSAEHTIGL